MTDARSYVGATAKFVHVTPRKARLVADHIRGRSVPEARTILAFMTRAAAHDIEKVLRSAVANAESNPNLRWNGDDLVIASVYVDEGPTHEALAAARTRSGQPDPEAAPATSRSSSSRRASRSAQARAGRARPRSVAVAGAARREPLRSKRGRAARRRWQRNGPEGASRRATRRRHSRLEVELDGRLEGVRGRAARGHQDPRAHRQEALARRPVGHPDPQGQAADHDRHLHGQARDRDRQIGRRG